MAGNETFAERLGSLLSEVLESGEIPNQGSKNFSKARHEQTEDFQEEAKDSENAGHRQQEKEEDTKKFSFFYKKNKTIGQIIRHGEYTEIPQEVIESFYLLGCAPSDSPKEIRAAFRKKIKESHPDSVNIKTKSDATAATEKLIAANEIIKNWLQQNGH